MGAAAAGRASGHDRVIGFDMGGTSTDVSRYDGDFEYNFEFRVGDAVVVAPALAIETVASGGGSICRVDHGQLKVGPESAGARPGPACYGAGGPLTITDVNLLLGRIDPTAFGLPIDVAAAERRAAEALAGLGGVDEQLLGGFLAIANERMADAIRRISISRGYDPTDYALVSFGGAGGQHACAIASELGMETVIVPVDTSLLSAVGLGHAVLERFAHRQVLEPLDGGGVGSVVESLEREALGRLLEERGANLEGAAVRRRIVRLRLLGQETALEVEPGSAEEARSADVIAALFAERYRAVYGYPPPEHAIEVESIRVLASTAPAAARLDRAGWASGGRRRRGWASIGRGSPAGGRPRSCAARTSLRVSNAPVRAWCRNGTASRSWSRAGGCVWTRPARWSSKGRRRHRGFPPARGRNFRGGRTYQGLFRTDRWRDWRRVAGSRLFPPPCAASSIRPPVPGAHPPGSTRLVLRRARWRLLPWAVLTRACWSASRRSRNRRRSSTWGSTVRPVRRRPAPVARWAIRLCGTSRIAWPARASIFRLPGAGSRPPTPAPGRAAPT